MVGLVSLGPPYIVISEFPFRMDCQHGMRETCKVGSGNSPPSEFAGGGWFLDPPYIFVSGSRVSATPATKSPQLCLAEILVRPASSFLPSNSITFHHVPEHRLHRVGPDLVALSAEVEEVGLEGLYESAFVVEEGGADVKIFECWPIF